MTSIAEYTKQVSNYRGLKRWTKAKQIARIAATGALYPLEVRKAKRLLQNQKPLRLHVGSGYTYLKGWVNIDLFAPSWMQKQDLWWDLRRGIPFPEDSAGAVYSEHLLEHLDLTAGLEHLKECRRVLAPGGVLRLGVPDLERYVHSYLGRNTLIENKRPGRPTRAIALGENFFFHEHKAMYDFETLELMLREVGFETVERAAFRKGRLDPPDSEGRQLETLYVEAIK